MTGCPSLSSTEDEDSASGEPAETSRPAASGYLAGGIRQLASSQDTLNNIGLGPAKMSGHRASFAATTADFEASMTSAASRQSRYLHQQSNMAQATKISITAPSPMGSTRDMSLLAQSPDNQLRRFQQGSSAAATAAAAAAAASEQQMIERMNELSMSGTGYDTSELLDENIRASPMLNQQTNQSDDEQTRTPNEEKERSRSQLIDELLKTINDDSFNDLVDFNNKFTAQTSGSGTQLTAAQLANANRPKSAMDSTQTLNTTLYKQQAATSSNRSQASGANSTRPSSLALNANQTNAAPPSTFDNVIRRMSTNFVQNFNKMSNSTLSNFDSHDSSALRREKSSQQANSLYVDNQVPARRHSDNTINIPRIQVAPSSPSAGSRAGGLNQRASVSASKLANKWKLSAKSNKRESSDKLSPNLSGALGYMRRHSSGNTTGRGNDRGGQSNGQGSHSLLNASPFKVSHRIA